MIDRLLPPEPTQLPERRTCVQDNGPRGDFQDWLQAPITPQDDQAHESIANSINATQFQHVAPGTHAHEPMTTLVNAAQLRAMTSGDLADRSIATSIVTQRQAAPTTTPQTAMELQGMSPRPSVTTPTDVHVQLQFVKRGGYQKTVVVPMRLAATGRLAWVTPMGHTDIPTAMPGDYPRTLPHGDASQHQRSSAALVQRTLPTNDTASTWVPSHHATGGPCAQGEPDDTEVRFTHARLTAAAESWLERLIRWTQRHGHSPVVWVRDYRLDDGGARDLTRSLQLRAHAEGFELARIVVNGREMWRAPSLLLSQEML